MKLCIKSIPCINRVLRSTVLSNAYGIVAYSYQRLTRASIQLGLGVHLWYSTEITEALTRPVSIGAAPPSSSTYLVWLV